MLGVNQLDFINYANALKGNYRKGIHKMEAIMASPTHAKEFASNLGGVSVVLSVPIGKEDRNSAQLLDLLLNSDVADDAVYTWLGQFYEFSSWDELFGDEDRCKAMMANELMWRALSASGVAMGKTVATLAGLSCSAYDDMSAVAASSTAMTAIFRSSTALQVVQNNASAWAIFSNASSAVMGKTVAELAGLNPSGYADMNAIASSSTAMTAIITNSTALKAVVSSSAAMSAVAASQTAMAAVIANATALNAVASSQTAMAAIATSSTAMSAISASTTAINALKASPLLVAKTKSGNNWTTETVRSGRGIAVYIYGASVSGGNGWVKTDNVQTTFSSNGTSQNLLKAFQTSLSVYWYQSSSTLYYIPC